MKKFFKLVFIPVLVLMFIPALTVCETEGGITTDGRDYRITVSPLNGRITPLNATATNIPNVWTARGGERIDIRVDGDPGYTLVGGIRYLSDRGNREITDNRFTMPNGDVQITALFGLGADIELLEKIANMSLEEKVGQMTQPDRSTVRAGDVNEFFLGSILSGGGSLASEPQAAPHSRHTTDGWHEMVRKFMQESLTTPSGIPFLYGIDAVHGHGNVRNATILPHNIGLGAIAVADLQKGVTAVTKSGEVTAKEMLATCIRFNFAPVMGDAQDIRWGRTY